MARRGVFSIAALSVSLVLSSAVAKADTLADAMIGAYNSSGLLQQNRAVLRAADEDVAQAVSTLRPVINWSGGVTRSFGSVRSSSTLGTVSRYGLNQASLALTAQLTLFDFGVNKLGVEAAKESVLATRERLLLIEQQVLLNAVQAFMEVRRTTENVALRENNVRLITQELRAARERFEVGEVTRTDVSLAEARLAAARSALAAARGALVIAQEQYKATVGHAPKNLMPPGAIPRVPATLDAVKAIAVKEHPQIKSIQHQVSAAELNVLRSQAAMKPNVRLTGSLSVTEDFGNDNFNHAGSVGIEATGPIYQGGRLPSLVRQAMANRDSARGNLHQTVEDVKQNAGNAYAQLGIARASREASERQVRASTVAFEGVREEAALGARTTLDVLNAEQELLNAKANQISAMVDEYIAAYSVLATMGRLTASDLHLKVQQYDPAAYYNLVKDAPIARSKQGKQLDRVLKALGKN